MHTSTALTRKLRAACAALLLAGAVLAPSALAKPRTPAAGTAVQVTLTTHDLRDALTRMPSVQFMAGGAHGASTLHVDDHLHFQSVIGFGAAMTDSSAWLLYDELPASTRAAVMNALFSGSTGIHLNFVRVPIGASDFSVTGKPYSYDDVAPGQADPTLAHFSIQHDEAYVIPSLRQMMAIDPGIDVISTEWSAPAWMKQNDASNNLGAAGTLLPLDYEPLANYFVKFIQAYQAHGVPIWAITPQNEPLAEAAYPGLELPAPNEARFIAQNLAPAIKTAGLHTQIYGADTGNLLSFAQALMQSPAAGDLAGMAWHCYGGQQVMTQFHAAYPNVPEITSECSPGIIPYGAAEAAISGLRNWASSISMWNLALDPSGGPVQAPDSGCPGCTGLVTVSEHTHTASYRLNYYQLGQLSKFVARGAVRVNTERFVSEDAPAGGHFRYGVTPGLDNVALVNPDGTRVLVAFNNASTRTRFAVSWRGKAFVYTLPAGGTVTFTWR